MTPVRLRLRVQGLVQGVGFRPFAYRLATEMGLTGRVCNSNDGAWVDVEGPKEVLQHFRDRLRAEAPPPCSIHQMDATWEAAIGRTNFEIAKSDRNALTTALILPDLATCPDCLRDIRDPKDRRYRYPFTTCTHCGPRFSILESLPYDRERTVMRRFPLCAACREEYEAPGNRRFHAEPIACPSCGPHLTCRSADGSWLGEREDALGMAVAALRDGRIVAVKGLGGYQLLVRADSDVAVQRLRERKQREAKPLALMCTDIQTVGALAVLSETERRLLESPAAPIVLLERTPNSHTRIAESVAPGNPWLGLMLPTTPLHHLLLADLNQVVVATSGNPSEEPLCTDDADARQRLRFIADVFLEHNRDIARPVDDSVTRVLLGTEQVLRRARGYAPLPVSVANPTTEPGPMPTVLAVGAQLKNSVAVSRGNEIFLSQHVGDLESARTCESFHNIIRDMTAWLNARAAVAAADLHPDYFSTQHAQSLGVTLSKIPHHEAHALSCLVDHGLPPPVLALVWDGTGLGPDGTLWGGDFLEITETECRRRATFRSFPLPGGDAASRDTRRCALGVLHEATLLDAPGAHAFLTNTFDIAETSPLRALLAGGIRSPKTSSVGRLFDAIASLLGLAHSSRFEGEAAMRLEGEAWYARPPIPPLRSTIPAEFAIRETSESLVVDWQPFVRALLGRDPNDSAGAWALAWHKALVQAAVHVARRIGLPHVLLTGGCFQNRLLTEELVRALHQAGLPAHWHQRIPPNDGGIAAGQVLGAWRRIGQPR